MMLFYLIAIAYFVAVNIYGFCLVKAQKDESDGEKANDKKLFFAGLLGGALTVYIFLFVYRFRLKNAFLMITLPVLIVVEGYLAFLLFRSGVFVPAAPMGDLKLSPFVGFPANPNILTVL